MQTEYEKEITDSERKRKFDAVYAKKRGGNMLATSAVALSGVLIGGVLEAASGNGSTHSKSGNISNLVEQEGDHQDIAHTPVPGTGMLHTKNGDFHVTQK